MKTSITAEHRAILINQYKILGFLDKENKAYYENLAEIYRCGYTTLYEQDAHKEMDAGVQKFVRDVLDMYNLINLYMENNQLACKKIKEHEYSVFGGFNNHETAMMTFAMYLVENYGRYDSVKKAMGQKKYASFIAPRRVEKKYRAMLDEFKKIDSEHDLTEEESWDEVDHWTEEEMLRVLDAK